jgi:hypothetical protein
MAVLFLDKELYKLEEYLAKECACESRGGQFGFLHNCSQIYVNNLRRLPVTISVLP